MNQTGPDATVPSGERSSRREPEVRTDFTPSEARWGIAWICIGALVTVLVEAASIDVLYGIPSILAALFLGGVFSRTALLWTSIGGIALVPTVTWAAGFGALFFGVEVTSGILAANFIPALVLFAAGCAGGVWPIARRWCHT